MPRQLDSVASNASEARPIKNEKHLATDVAFHYGRIDHTWLREFGDFGDFIESMVAIRATGRHTAHGVHVVV